MRYERWAVSTNSMHGVYTRMCKWQWRCSGNAFIAARISNVCVAMPYKRTSQTNVGHDMSFADFITSFKWNDIMTAICNCICCVGCSAIRSSWCVRPSLGHDNLLLWPSMQPCAAAPISTSDQRVGDFLLWVQEKSHFASAGLLAHLQMAREPQAKCIVQSGARAHATQTAGDRYLPCSRVNGWAI